ncbi:TadE/TadG family type IV pilus assembly protein [Sphingomonas abietis]|uniref:Pilus assembly protein n=1 Tax=Sphingomonas abietis TaxID=3012344 RepID=A0ABY7NIA4_9SPHN|nr:TadE family protein [Sphingomonas abietis]WBO21252.1 pilus assembly protein [Sphingomonas abietis]
MTAAVRLGDVGSNESGVTLVEFALLAPVFMILLMGMFDVAHTLYMEAALEGVVQKTARDSSIQDNNTAAGQAALDATITAQVKRLDNVAVVTPTRLYYKDYADAARQYEPFSDANGDGKCDNNESYTDENGNGVWDAQLGTNSGGAQDKTLYKVTVTYPRLFPMAGLIGLPKTVTLMAETVLAVQPYADQVTYSSTPQTLHCS